MESNLSPDLLRSLALSITYVLHRPRSSASLNKKKSLRFAASSPRPGSSKSTDSDKYVSSTALGTEMMRNYVAVLCNPTDPAPLRKFAKAVTNKVCAAWVSDKGRMLTIYAVAFVSLMRGCSGSCGTRNEDHSSFAGRPWHQLQQEVLREEWWLHYHETSFETVVEHSHPVVRLLFYSFRPGHCAPEPRQAF